MPQLSCEIIENSWLYRLVFWDEVVKISLVVSLSLCVITILALLGVRTAMHLSPGWCVIFQTLFRGLLVHHEAITSLYFEVHALSVEKTGRKSPPKKRKEKSIHDDLNKVGNSQEHQLVSPPALSSLHTASGTGRNHAYFGDGNIHEITLSQRNSYFSVVIIFCGIHPFWW